MQMDWPVRLLRSDIYRLTMHLTTRLCTQAEWGASGLPEVAPPATGGEPLGHTARTFYGLLGQLYGTARHQLVHMASALEVGAALAPSDDGVSWCT